MRKLKIAETYRRRSLISRGIVAAIGFVTLGYVSNLASSRRCEIEAANSIAEELGYREVFLLPDATSAAARDYSQSATILTGAGFVVRRCKAFGEVRCDPAAYISRAQMVGPFLVNVHWGFGGPLYGHGTRTTFFTFFGWTSGILHRLEWVS